MILKSSAKAYRESVVGPYRGVFPEAVVATMEEQLSGACTVEIAAFDEFTGFLTNSEIVNLYDHIIFETAPTGHTLRLLQRTYCLEWIFKRKYTWCVMLRSFIWISGEKIVLSKAVSALANPDETTLILVSRPDVSSL